jgi:hypothetical protein
LAYDFFGYFFHPRKKVKREKDIGTFFFPLPKKLQKKRIITGKQITTI